MPNLPYGPCHVCSTHSSTFAPALTQISKVMLLGTDTLSLNCWVAGLPSATFEEVSWASEGRGRWAPCLLYCIIGN